MPSVWGSAWMECWETRTAHSVRKLLMARLTVDVAQAGEEEAAALQFGIHLDN